VGPGGWSGLVRPASSNGFEGWQGLQRRQLLCSADSCSCLLTCSLAPALLLRCSQGGAAGLVCRGDHHSHHKRLPGGPAGACMPPIVSLPAIFIRREHRCTCHDRLPAHVPALTGMPACPPSLPALVAWMQEGQAAPAGCGVTIIDSLTTVFLSLRCVAGRPLSS
jgi:hypothetical protein